MNQPGDSRVIDKAVGDLLDATGAATEIVARRRGAWQADRLLRLAGEAVISRIGDAAGRLPADARSAMADVPWDDIRANRILVAHIYHRVDPETLWTTLAQDVPRLGDAVGRWWAAERAKRSG